MSDKITVARAFYANFLHQTQLQVGEASAVQAMIAFADEQVKPAEVDVKETPEYKELYQNHENLKAAHGKAEGIIKHLEADVATLKTPKVEKIAPEKPLDLTNVSKSSA